MMGRKSKQLSMVMIDMEELMPQDHLLRKIKRMIDFDFIYEEAADYYSPMGRPSIDPVCLIKMLLVGYLYGIRSERRLEEEITLNMAYRWFCGFDLMDRIPDHSTFSQNRRRRFNDSLIFRKIFNRIVSKCMEAGIVSGEAAVSDGSFIPANVSWGSRVEIQRAIEKSTVDYLEALEEELRNTKGYTEPIPTIIERKELKSSTDADCGYVHHDTKKGLGYLAEMTVDTANGIITGVDCYPANRRESDIILKHIERQTRENNLNIQTLGLDAGYDVGAVHRGLEIMGITGYASLRYAHNNPMKEGFAYQPESDEFICRKGKALSFSKLIFKKGTGYYRLYHIKAGSCRGCEKREECKAASGSIRISASPYYPAYYANRMRHKTTAYVRLKRLRGIWSEGTFAALKNFHNLKRHRKRGIHRAAEECILAATALNLKRFIKAVGALEHR
jgi:transposase